MEWVVLGAGQPGTTAASCAAMTAATACVATFCSRPSRSSAARTPTQPLTPDNGTATAPFDAASAGTVRICALRHAAAVAFGALRGMGPRRARMRSSYRSEEHTSELQSLRHLV